MCKIRIPEAINVSSFYKRGIAVYHLTEGLPVHEADGGESGNGKGSEQEYKTSSNGVPCRVKYRVSRSFDGKDAVQLLVK